MRYVVAPRGQGPRAHLPVAIVIDCSESTEDIRRLLNKSAQKLLQNLKDDPFLRDIVELLVIHYSRNYEVVVDFQPLEQIESRNLDILRSEGPTNTGSALLYALQRLNERKVQWKLAGEKYSQPLLFLLTDGYPDAGIGAPPVFEKQVMESYKAAGEQIRTMEQDGKLVFIAAGIQQKNGYRANMDKLRELSGCPDRILRIVDSQTDICNLEQFYNLIFQSTNAMFQDTPIDEVIDDFIHA